jgi:NAD(P)-dependent dehydrogenase (short-subunit alcohol dehydrogenase family)
MATLRGEDRGLGGRWLVKIEKLMNLIITGATGIAEATAKMAVVEGHNVFVISKDQIECQALAETLHIPVFVADLTQASEVEVAIAAATQTLGRIDGLFNVAGISGRRFGDGPLHECTETGWDVVMEANLKSHFLVTRAVLNQMLMQEPNAYKQCGSIVHMASILAMHPEPTNFATHAYAVSKGAIIALTTSTAAYYAAHGIRINAVAPGLVSTPMSARAQESEVIQHFLPTKQPLAPDFIAPETIAKAALFLLSEDSQSTTGLVLTVDGGWRVS